MQRKLNKIAKDTNLFLKRFITNQKKSNLIVAMKYGLFSGGKKIRSKILIDVGSLFNLDYKLIKIDGDVAIHFPISNSGLDMDCNSFPLFLFRFSSTSGNSTGRGLKSDLSPVMWTSNSSVDLKVIGSFLSPLILIQIVY